MGPRSLPRLLSVSLTLGPEPARVGMGSGNVREGVRGPGDSSGQAAIPGRTPGLSPLPRGRMPTTSRQRCQAGRVGGLPAPRTSPHLVHPPLCQWPQGGPAPGFREHSIPCSVLLRGHRLAPSLPPGRPIIPLHLNDRVCNYDVVSLFPTRGRAPGRGLWLSRPRLGPQGPA